MNRVDAQYEMESQSVERGIALYRNTLQKDGTGSLPPGQQLIKAAMGPMIAAVDEWRAGALAGKAARNAGVIHFINQIPSETLAWVTAKTALNMLHLRPSLAKAATTVALELEGTVNIDAMMKDYPALATKLSRVVARMNATRNKVVFIRRGAAMADVESIQWDDATRVRCGSLLLSLFVEAAGLVAFETMSIGYKKLMVLRPTEACARWLEEAHARCELLSPQHLPMVCPPLDWTTPWDGGYLTPALRQGLVKTRNQGYLQSLALVDMPWVYAAVNRLQATAWAVNVQVHDVVKHLWETNSDLPCLPRRGLQEMPARSWGPDDTPDSTALTVWKTAAARVHEVNERGASKRIQVSQKLWVAEEMMRNGNEFHYVYKLDWRGRMYPVGPSLTPQGDDLAKGMLTFARAEPLGDDGVYWLAVQGANTFGVDKVAFGERIEWVQTNEEMILGCAADPYANTQWAEADAPFGFLAFCFEWAALQAHVDAGENQADFMSRLPVAFDGTCNGLQNFSAMLRDPIGGAATGLVPSDRPVDLYTQVKDAAQEIIDKDAAEGNPVAQRWVGKMTRTLAKRNTMTVPYGVTARGMRDQLFAELTTSAPENRADDALYLSRCNYAAIGQVVVAARIAMDWLRDVAKVAASTGLPVRWTTPSGFPALQDYREQVGVSVDFTVLGRRIQLMLQRDGDKLATRKQALGIAPNFVHSLDAAHLMRTVLFCAADGVEDFAMIHDSYGVHAGKAELLRDNLRDAFVEQYSEPVLEAFRNEMLAQLPEESHALLPPVPPLGTLDLEAVRKSDYFFA